MRRLGKLGRFEIGSLFDLHAQPRVVNMKMNKLMASIFFSLVLVSSAACPAENSTPLRHPLDAHLSRADTGDLSRMIEARYVRVLTTMNQTNFFLDGAKPHGFEYALLKEYETFLNKGIKRTELRITFEFIPAPRDKLLEYLAAGYGDIAAAGLTITTSRKQQVEFSIPYLTGVSELLVTHRDAPPISTLDDLAGKKLFVRKSSNYFESITALNRTLTQKGKPPVKIIEADEDLETEEILEMVNSGAIRMTVCDSYIADIWSKILSDIEIHKEIVFRQGGEIAWAVRKNNPELKKSLNEFLKSHRKGTLLGNIFFNRYYKDMKWIKNPLKGQLGLKMAEYRPVFKKYADRYGFDWRLVMAIAFQESGLDHSKKSGRGAVGLMQIKPSTAADPRVGIDNIDSVEDNVHAAVKYLAFIRDRYFSDKDILPRDQVRLSLAAYNAGPAKIRRAIQKTGEMNLDPNKWFRNVELAVLRNVGQEPVRYVSNINKYYVIYNGALEAGG
jgi:membrane-bound lytic murein transglycosylase MltF